MTLLDIRLLTVHEYDRMTEIGIFDEDEYEDHHPTPSQIYLIVEVADTALRTDCGIKAKIYLC